MKRSKQPNSSYQNEVVILMVEPSSRPRIRFLSEETIEKIHLSATRILEKTGVMYNNQTALELLAQNGATVDFERKIAKIPSSLVEEKLKEAPSKITLHDRDGRQTLHVEKDNVYFNPGSTAINILDSETGELRKPVTRDLEDFVRLTDALNNMHAQSTALVVSDVPEAIVDRYRLYVVLKGSKKPVVTGAFTVEGLHDMKQMLSAVVGEDKLSEKPLAVFDVCPSPPLMWSYITSQNLIDCAQYGIPAEIVSMPLSGATGPASLAGTIVLHTAETLSGIVLAQLSNPGAPVIYGGSPAVFDMKYGTTPMGAIETIMIDCAYGEMGKHYGLPTHAYIGLSDSKLVDAQAGFESGIGLVMGALAGINIISSAGMLDFESCQSLEKLVIDNELCGMALRIARGIDESDESLAVSLIEEIGSGGHYLTTRHTLDWFTKEQYMPSAIIDRMDRKAWKERGSKNSFQRAREAVQKILQEHRPEPLAPDVEKQLTGIGKAIFEKNGVRI